MVVTNFLNSKSQSAGHNEDQQGDWAKGMIDLRISSFEELTTRVEDKAGVSMLGKKDILERRL
jgi:hypothetical protein